MEQNIQSIIKDYSKKIWPMFNPEIANGKYAGSYLAGKLLNEITELLACKNNRDSVIDECGDVLWYICNLHTLFSSEKLPENSEFTILNEDEIITEILIESGKLVGMLFKRDFHGKQLYTNDILIELDSISQLFDQYLMTQNIKISEVIDHNLNKLLKRHGITYNKNFYQKPEELKT